MTPLSGSAVRLPNGERWYVKGDKKYRIPSDDIYRSCNFPSTFLHTSGELSHLEDCGTLGFRPGTIVFSLYHMSYWYISDRGRYRISNPAVFKGAGRSRFDVPMVKRKDLELHEDLGVIE